MSFRKYEEYKESGIEWLGEVPKHWEIRRLGVYGNFIAGSGFPHNEQGQKSGDYPFYKVSDTNLEGNSVYLLKAANYVTKEVTKKLRAKIAPAGGIMFPKVGAALLGNKRRVLTRESITDNNTIVFIPYSGVSKYWYYWLSELDFGQIANPGPVPSINEAQLREFPSICPPEEEQKQIAAFLDRETTNIDTLIDKQEQLITLLREKRQAIISHAVTRGLNSNVKMQDSGIEWLGAVPEHWEVKKIKHILLQKKDSIKVGPFGSQLTTKDMEGADIKVINQRNVIDNDFDFGDNFINHEKYIELRAFTIFPGDILITTRGTIGRTAIFPNKNDTSILHPCLMRLQVDEKYWLKELIALIIQGSGYFLEQLKLLSNATTIDVIYSENLKNVTIALPPTHEEQKRIIAFLDKETAKIDTLIEKCKTAIELLKERRTALISAAVTGKIDVRSAV